MGVSVPVVSEIIYKFFFKRERNRLKKVFGPYCCHLQRRGYDNFLKKKQKATKKTLTLPGKLFWHTVQLIIANQQIFYELISNVFLPIIESRFFTPNRTSLESQEINDDSDHMQIVCLYFMKKGKSCSLAINLYILSREKKFQSPSQHIFLPFSPIPLYTYIDPLFVGWQRFLFPLVLRLGPK